MTLIPPDKQEIELEVNGLFVNGDIKQIAKFVQRDAGLVSKMLSANCDDRNNIVYFGLLFLWAFDCQRRELGDQVVNIILRERAKWLGGDITSGKPAAQLTKNILTQFAEFLEAEQDGKDDGTKIKECMDIISAAKEKLTDLIAKRNARVMGTTVEIERAVIG